MNSESFQSCMDACISCALECEHCVTECLQRPHVQNMLMCIELSRECAVICRGAAILMSVSGMNATILCDVCAEICEQCSEECLKHELQHCRHCGEECRQCAEECRRMSAEMQLGKISLRG